MLCARIPENVKLAVLALGQLSRCRKPQPMTAVAASLQCSPAHLSKVLQMLCQRGLAVSKRGPNGGYSVTEAAVKMSVADALQRLAGVLRWGVLQRHVRTRRLCQLADAAALRVLGGRSLRDL